MWISLGILEIFPPLNNILLKRLQQVTDQSSRHDRSVEDAGKGN